MGCRYDRAARLWDLDTGKCLGEFSGHRSIVTWAKLSPDDSRMVTASFDCTLKGTRSAAQFGHRAILHLVLTAVGVCVRVLTCVASVGHGCRKMHCDACRPHGQRIGRRLDPGWAFRAEL